MVAVLAIAYGRHCEDESCLWETVADELYGFVEVGGALGDGQLPLLKQALWPFLAVVHYLARLLENVDVVGAKGHHGSTLFVGRERHGVVLRQASHGVQDAGGVVHHAIRIDHGAELLFCEPLADIVGEARAYEQHALARLYLPRAFGNVYYGSEFHATKLLEFLVNSR